MSTEKNSSNPILSSEEILAIRKKRFIGAVSAYYRKPLHLVRASGTYVYDDQGRAYLDCIGGIVSISAGHNHPRIKQKLLEMIGNDQIQHTSTLYLNSYVAELAEKITSEAPAGVDHVFFTNSGSEANELALLAARHATGHNMIVNLRHSYHGGTSGTLAACGHHTWRFDSQPVTGVTSALEPNCYRCPFGKKPESCALECAKNVETTIQTSTSGKIAAFIAEPVMGVGGFISPPKEYFAEVAEIAHRYGGKYISDEVQTGAGRCGKTFLLTKDLEIPADIVTMAKGFGNGAAIGATLMSAEISTALAGKTYFNTFGGDPYQTAQASLTMDIIQDEKLIEKAQVQGAYLRDALEQLKKKHSLIGDVRGRGLLMGVELVKDRVTKEYATSEAAELMEQCRERGVLVGKGGLYGNVIRLAPPLTITRTECDTLIKAIDESLAVLAKT